MALTDDNWTKHSDNPLLEYGHHDPGIYHEDGTFYLYTWNGSNGSDGNIDCWTSSDGVNYSHQGEVLTGTKLMDPEVHEIGGQYWMYYGSNDEEIRLAKSSSLTSGWSDAGLLFDYTSVGFADAMINEPTVIVDPQPADSSRKYKMLFTGGDGTSASQENGAAFSATGDVGDWTLSADNPVFTASETHNGNAPLDPDLYYQNNRYYQYYNTTGTSETWKAYTTDGSLSSWTLVGSNPVLSVSSSGWDSNNIYAPDIVEVDGTYYHYYQGNDGSGNQTVGLATGEVAGPATSASAGTGTIHTVSASISSTSGSARTVPPTATVVYDSFEDQDISEYSGQTGSFTVASDIPAKDGSYALKQAYDGSGDSFAIASFSGDGLDGYPSQGTPFRAFFYAGPNFDNHYPRIVYAPQGTSGFMDGYNIVFDQSNTEFKVEYRSGGSNQATYGPVNVDYSGYTEEWLEVYVDWTTAGDHTVTLYDSAGNQLANLSFTDTNYSSKGIGWTTNGGGTSSANNFYFDYLSEA
jgi:hypothetical protein